MKLLSSSLALMVVISGCSQEASHRVGKSVRVDAPGAAFASVTKMVNGNEFMRDFVAGIPPDAKVGALNKEDVTFKVWKALEGGVNVAFDLPGTPETDVERIGEYLLKLIESRLRKE